MAFSSNFFLFGFFPVVIAIYALAPAGLRNPVLLVASLVFYAFDAGWLIWLLIASILLNHVVARALPRLSGGKRDALFIIGVALNLSALLHFKYAGFLWDMAASLLDGAGVTIGPAPKIELPIGISFFTFQALSYIADVYTGRVPPARRLIDFGMYHSLFPQLIAGPIVRYVEVADAVEHAADDARPDVGRRLPLLHRARQETHHRRHPGGGRRSDLRAAGRTS